MKNTLKYIALALVVIMTAASCEDFLTRPAEDSYNESNFYQDENQCIQGVNYLYNAPWYDVIRGFYRIGECFSGNYFMGSSPYQQFTLNGSDAELFDMSKSLWAVNANAMTVYNRIKRANVSEDVKKMCMGEALTWKAMAFFFLVRTFGDVPIIHDVSVEVAEGTYNTVYKAPKAQVYDYIIMVLEEAMKLLPKKVGNMDGRIDYYSAEALLAKVYLQKAGVTGTLVQADLDEAARLAKDVIEHSGRSLMETYSDVFRLQNNKNIEALISWHWYSPYNQWTCQNSFQSDLAVKGMDEFADTWGEWNGPSIALQDQFGVSAIQDPSARADVDTRRKATMMLAGDKYDYFWTANGGFDYLRFFYDPDYGPSGTTRANDGEMKSPTGAGCVKFLYGDGTDHKNALGVSAARMSNGLATHILRLADIYLVYCEAKLGGPGTSTTDEFALKCYNDIRNRAIPGAVSAKTSITFEEVFKERNLELALEGDRWYDYVRVGYYNPNFVVTDIQAQRRNGWKAGATIKLDDVYKSYYETGNWNTADITYDTDQYPIPSEDAILAMVKSVPFPSEDVVFNPNLDKDAQECDLSRFTF